MAGKTIDMSRIKQLLQLKKLGLSNRQIAKELKISRDKTNEYVRMAELDSLDIDALLRLDDPVLEKRFHPGNPAYTDSRMETFLELLPEFSRTNMSPDSLYGRNTSGLIRTGMRSRSSTSICRRT